MVRNSMDLINFLFFSLYFLLKLLFINILYGVYILYCELIFIYNEFISGKLVIYYIDIKYSIGFIYGNKY